MNKAPKPQEMDLKVGSMHYKDYLDSLIDDENGRFVKLSKLLEVPSSPDHLTPRVFQRKIIEMRNVKSELEDIRRQLNNARFVPDRKLRFLDEEIELTTSYLRSNDPDVRSGRNMKEQDALVREKLRDKYEERSMYQTAVDDITYVIRVVKNLISDARNAQSQLRELKAVWSDDRKDAYHYRFTADENPLPKPEGPDGELDTRTQPELEELEDPDFFEDEEEEDLDLEEEEDAEGLVGEDEDDDPEEDDSESEEEESEEAESEEDDDLLDEDEDEIDFDLDEDEEQMNELLPSEFTDEEVGNFLDSEENPDFSDSSMEDHLDDILEDFDIDDD